MPRDVTVTITRDETDEKKCKITPRKFSVDRGGTVNFNPVALPPIKITFDRKGSPFADNPIGKGKHTVKNGPGAFDYVVTWPEPSGEGSGDGQGEVTPG
jgi:hypothetical protein